jgi:hypothetical protein
MRWIGLAAALALAATGTWAQDKGAQQSPPLSVWRIDAANAEHLQSGLGCPATLRSYRRTELYVYDRFGLDVSCNYLDAAQSDVTVYLTRRPTGSLDDAMAEAKREFLQVRAAMHPQPISETRPTVGGLAWQLALYGVDGGMRDAIWIADLDGWTLELRVTYRADAEAAVQADMAAFTDAARGSAGARLDLCGKSLPPARTGALVPGGKDASTDAMMSALLGGAASSAAAKGAAQAPRVTWCVETASSNGQVGVLFWRGVHDDGGDAAIDRVTAMTVGEPPQMTVHGDDLAAIVDKANGRPAKWTAETASGGTTRIYGYFDGRPTAPALEALFLDALNGKAPMSSYSVEGGKITIGMPASK